MAWASVANRGGANTKTSGTYVEGKPSGDISVGNVAFVAAISDNISTSDGETNEHTITDDSSNTWTKLKEYCNGNGSAAAGVTVSLWATKVTTLIESANDNIRLTIASSVAAKAFCVWEASLTSGNTFTLIDSVTGVVDANTSGPSMSLPSGASLTSQEYLWLAVDGMETGSGNAYTKDADYTAAANRATSGTDDTNLYVYLARRIRTATSDTYQGSSVGTIDWASIFVAVAERLDASTTPTTIARSVSIPTPTVTASAGPVPTTVARSVSIPTPTVSGGAIEIGDGEEIEIGPLEMLASIPTPTVSAITPDASPVPTTVARAVSIPTPVVESISQGRPFAFRAGAGGSALGSDRKFRGEFSVDFPITPNSITLAANIPTPTVDVPDDSSPTAGGIDLLVDIPTPIVSTARVVSFAFRRVVDGSRLGTTTRLRGESSSVYPMTPDAIVLAASIPTPVVGIADADALVTTPHIEAWSSVEEPTIEADAAVTPDTVVLAAEVPTPVVGTQDVSLTTTTVTRAVAIPTPSLAVTGIAVPTTISRTVSIPTPVVSAGKSVAKTLSTIAARVSIPTPTVSGPVREEPIRSAKIGRLGLAVQSALGTPATNPDWTFGVIEMLPNPEQVTTAHAPAAHRLVTQDIRKGTVSWASMVRIHGHPGSAGAIIKNLLPTEDVTGVGPYAHTFSPGNDAPYLTLFSTRTGNLHERFDDGVIESLSFEWEQGGRMSMLVQALGRVPQVVPSYSGGTYEDDGTSAEIFDYAGASMGVAWTGDQSVMNNITAGAFRITRTATVAHTADGVTPLDILRGPLSAELMLDLVWDSWDGYRNSFYGSPTGTTPSDEVIRGSFQFVFATEVGSRTLTISAPAVALLWDPPQPSTSGGGLRVRVYGTVVRQDGSDFVSIALTNTRASSY